MIYTLPTIPIIGWAAVYGVTGGGSGTLHHFDDLDLMWDDMIATGNTPKNYIYTGPDVNLLEFAKHGPNANSRLNIPNNNKTILSSGTQELLNGSIRLDGRSNIIWANWRHRRTNHEPIGVYTGSEGIVIDHCDFDNEDFPLGESDSIIDYRGDSDFGQITNCKMKNTGRVIAIGASLGDNNGKLNLTIAFNTLGSHKLRKPRVSQGKVHYFANWNTQNVLPLNAAVDTDVEVANFAQFYSELNYYELGKKLWTDATGTGSLKSVNDFIGTYSERTVEIRPENVTWVPSEVENYILPILIDQTKEGVIDYTNENSGAILFLTPTTYTLTLTTATGGTATRNPATGDIEQNATVILTATPDAGFNFSRWENVLTGQTLSGSETYNHVMLDDISIVAVFVSDAPVDPGDAIRVFRVDD